MASGSADGSGGPASCKARSGDDVHVVEEGLNGRTTVFDVPEDPDRNGLTFLPAPSRRTRRSTCWCCSWA